MADDLAFLIAKKYQYGFAQPEQHVFKSRKGLSSSVVEEISWMKNEPSWMREFRLKSYSIFAHKSLPNWGADLSKINFDEIYYYVKPTEKTFKSWDEVPAQIKNTFDKLGIPEAERKFLAGVEAMYDSETVYSSLKEHLTAKGVIFCDTDTALREHQDIFREYFATVVPPADNKFAALNSCVWSGGSFIYVPPDTRVELPLQAYFRINTNKMGQFERTLIIVDQGAQAHYIEGCTASMYSEDALHAAVVEIIVKKGAKFQYTTVQNWSLNVYNLVTKRAFVEEEGEMFWLDCNMGSRVSMKYPSFYLKGRGAKGEVLSLATAGAGQHQDVGAKAFHLAPDTSSLITSKSISFNGGRTSYRGLVKVVKNAQKSRSHVVCDALILDENSRSDTYPTMQIEEDNVSIGHEATVSKIGEDQLFYLRSRGLSEVEARAAIVNGFIEPVVKRVPLEYAVELNRLVELEMENAVG